ncbi:MAG: KEOPS complex subunit Pcc1 [Candidatus Jordarchaeaceae archaeon]
MLRVKTEISIEYQNQKQAEIIIRSLMPDNKPLPKGISINMTAEGRKANIVVECVCRPETLISTVDDILEGVCLAEGIIFNNKEEEKE